MATKQLILPGDIIKKSNALARARWSAESVWEPRLVALLASKVRADDTDFHIYQIPVSEILRDSGGRNYREIETVVDRVMSRVLTIRDPKGWTKYNVFSRCRYRREEGILELGFHPDLRPHYLNLQKNFAKYNLMEFLLLPSIYSQRIFEILKSWDDKPEVEIYVSDLHEMLNTPESSKKNFAEFKRYVLEKAHKDILKYTKFEYEWEPIKRGRSVVSVRFIFSKRKSLKATKQKTDDEKKKQSERNNAIFLTVTECRKQHINDCTGGHQKKVICDFCHNLP